MIDKYNDSHEPIVWVGSHSYVLGEIAKFARNNWRKTKLATPAPEDDEDCAVEFYHATDDYHLSIKELNVGT